MAQLKAETPGRLTLDNPPKTEGPFRLKGEVRRPLDAECGFDVLDDFERFHQANDIYSRAQWDPRIRSKKAIDWFKGMFMPGLGVRKAEGYGVKDFALRNAGWMGTNLVIQRSLDHDRVDGFGDFIRPYSAPNPQKIEAGNPAEMSEEIKRVCRLFGADGVGVTAYDPRWHFTNNFSIKTLTEKPYGIADDLPNVIVIVTSMHYDAVRCYPSATAGVAVGHGYSKDCELVQTIATYILNLGYRAIASVNDTSQAIPYAVQAGLGEYGRNGLLITKDFGPRVRIGRIHTDLPLAHDKPVRFGVRDFCETTCRRCADSCPPKAISDGAPTESVPTQSQMKGIRKWQVNPEKCFKFWANQGTECGICMRVCPYNKDISRWWKRAYYRFWQRLAASPLKRAALWLDISLGFGKRMKPNEYWRRFRSR
ncbi:MAG: reductive dehalogenase [Rhodospirillaceae bacterium]|nr:reductive dehalogenase [Rhodospirillaceae bacterium]